MLSNKNPDNADSAHARFKAFFDQSTSFSALLSPSGLVIEVNHLALDATGFKREDVVDIFFWDCGWWSASEELAGYIRLGVEQAANGDSYRREMPYFLANGSSRLVDVAFSPVLNAQNQVIYIAATGVDTTARNQAETSLHTAYESFRHLVEKSPFGVYAIDSDFRIYLVADGAQKVFENVSPLIGADFTEVLRTLWPEPFVKEAISRFRNTLLTGEPYHAPSMVEQRSDSGDIESYDWKVERVMLPNGNYGVVCYFYDLSEREHFERELREQAERKNVFLATLAHELRYPLAAMNNAVTLLRMQDDISDEAKWGVDIIERQTSHLVRLVDDLLDLNRISAGRINLDRGWVSLVELIETVVETTKSLLDRRQHELTVSLPSKALEVECDKIRLAQVISNLLANAAKYTDKNGLIELKVGRIDTGLFVSVTDNGCGLAKENLTKVFDSFWRAPQHNKQDSDGLGIGLSLSKKLVELHGGNITAQSEGLDRGSRFEIHLPIPIKLEEIKSTKHIQHAEEKSSGRRVLLAEDHRDTAQAMAKILQILGHDVRITYDGEAAVSAVAEFKPDVIFLDIGMPKLDGFGACAQIRQKKLDARPLIVAVTGFGQDADRLRATAAGFDHHVVKPLNMKVLTKLLAEI